jgi:NADPH-dependent glutamate synthase beta subunit-like oxidoreductase
MIIEARPLSAEFNLDAVLKEGFDAVFIAAGLVRSVRVFNEPSEGSYGALEFLAAAAAGDLAGIAGKRVAVIGGGNTAMDVAMTAVKLGAKDVYVIYRRSFAQMPAWRTMLGEALSKGVHFLILSQVLEVKSRRGRLVGLVLCPTILAETDESGRRGPKPLSASAYQLPCDVFVEAIGQQADPEIASFLPGVEVFDGLIKTRGDSLETSRSGVFAGGDIVQGPATVVAAVADGLRGAAEIDRYLSHAQDRTRGTE